MLTALPKRPGVWVWFADTSRRLLSSMGARSPGWDALRRADTDAETRRNRQ
jgi:hypothetical protein